jgi:hypothetical protein
VIKYYVCDSYFQLADGGVVSLAAIDPHLETVPLAQFCPGTSLNSDPTNFWSPNTANASRVFCMKPHSTSKKQLGLEIAASSVHVLRRTDKHVSPRYCSRHDDSSIWINAIRKAYPGQRARITPSREVG